MEHYRTQLCYCLKCGYQLDAATPLTDGKPSPGDISICFNCANAAQYGPDLNIIPLTDEQLDALIMNEEVWTQILKAKEVIKRRLWEI